MSLRRHPSRPPRPSVLLAVGALLAAPALTSCGFDYATDRVNIISGGINDREGQVDVLGAVVVAGEDNVGLFVAGLVNNSTDEADALTGMQPATSEDGVSPSTQDVGVDIPAAGQVNLYDTGGIPVEGTFVAGDFVDVSLTFENGQVSTLQVPVVTPCHQYSPEKLPNLELPVAAEESAASTDEANDAYSCEPIPQEPEAEGEE